jgi:enterochelin esterase-like enzyme
MIDHYPIKSLSIIFDCGSDDFFYAVNKNLHAKMLRLGIPHDYIERPGGHTNEYWQNSIDYQLLYFKKFFTK